MKKEEEYDSEDDFDITTPAVPALAAKMEKDEEEEDSDEDEGDWEEVEGLSTSIGFMNEKGVMLTKFKWYSTTFTLVACDAGHVTVACFSVDQSWRNHWVQLNPQNLPCHPSRWK